MKKLLLALCAVMMFSLSACKKDNVEPENPSGSGNGGSNHQTEIPTGEGVFNPAQRIVGISIDGEESEEWEWANDVLTAIMTADGGNMIETSSFEYDNYRVSRMFTRFQGMPLEVEYTYTGDKLASVMATSGSMEILSIVFGHNATGKVSNMTMSVNEYVLAMLSQLIGNEFPNIFGKGPLATMERKLNIQSTSFSADMDWQGENVTRFILNGEIGVEATLAEIRQMVNIDSLLGTYASFLSVIPDSTVIPMTIVVCDTNEFTYDSQHNPFYGFLGRIDPTVFSANNVTASTTGLSAVLTATLNLGFMTLPLSFPLPLPVEAAPQSFTYTYDAAGFPVTATDGNGSVTQYIYQQ